MRGLKGSPDGIGISAPPRGSDDEWLVASRIQSRSLRLSQSFPSQRYSGLAGASTALQKGRRERASGQPHFAGRDLSYRGTEGRRDDPPHCWRAGPSYAPPRRASAGRPATLLAGRRYGMKAWRRGRREGERRRGICRERRRLAPTGNVGVQRAQRPALPNKSVQREMGGQ